MNTAGVRSHLGRSYARSWAWRYVWAELAALVLSVACALLADVWTNNVLLLAASAYGGSTGYYGVLLLRETINNRRALRATLRAMVVEFGSAEVLDSVLFSPMLLAVCVALVPNVALAVVLSEIASTAIFYAVVIAAHERRKAYVRRRTQWIR